MSHHLREKQSNHKQKLQPHHKDLTEKKVFVKRKFYVHLFPQVSPETAGGWSDVLNV